LETHGERPHRRISLLPTIVLIICRGILHDPEVFENPLEFRPERYLKNGKINPEVLDPDVAAFGFGRRSVSLYGFIVQSSDIWHRLCPGRHLAHDTLFILITSVLSVFNILPPKDENGNEVKVEARFGGGAVMCVLSSVNDGKMTDMFLSV